jgi:NAD(P)-dependent dehydrogenase (short-subunit alcohol dehydrogenase family)
MDAITWVSGASAGIGRALAATVPWGGRVIGISRRPPEGIEHLEADLADPASWAEVDASFHRELAGFEGERATFVHAAGTLDPIGFAGEVETDAYRDNVVLNSAAPQVLGHLFLAAAAGLAVPRHLVMLTSGAAQSVYPGWSSYGAAKAATDQWVRDVGAEQSRRGGVRVLAVAPGTVDTDMQARMRATSEHDFPARSKFVDLHREGRLSDPEDVARRIWALLDNDLDNGAVVDLRQLNP